MEEVRLQVSVMVKKINKLGYVPNSLQNIPPMSVNEPVLRRKVGGKKLDFS